MSWPIMFAAIALLVAALVAVYVFVVRPWHLHWGATPTEVAERLPGDEMMPYAMTEATHAITIHAPPSEVWPWLVQLGQDRAGFYSYTWLENLFGCHMRNTYRIVDEWQHLQAGEGVVFHPKMPRVPAAVVDPPHALVLGGYSDPCSHEPIPADAANLESCMATSWAFVLRETAAGDTRLIVRLRGSWPNSCADWMSQRLFWEPAHFIMERRMLLTIKRLAEEAVRLAHV